MINESSMRLLEQGLGTQTVTVVPNFLKTSVAYGVYRDLSTLTHQSLWFRAHFGQPDYVNLNTSSATDAGYSSYSFGKYPIGTGSASAMTTIDSTRDDVSLIRSYKGDLLKSELGAGSAIFKLTNYLKLKSFRERMARATKNRQLNSYDLSLTRYGRSDFCSPHTDIWEDRRVTFLLHLAKIWAPHWGGHLAILNADYSQIVKIIGPSFNSLVIFEVPLPHCVLPVSSHCPVFRYTLGGWYYGQA